MKIIGTGYKTLTIVKDGEPGPPGPPGEPGDITLDWVKDWDSNKTEINNQRVVTPRIFAGSVKDGVPTGVALGKNIFGSNGPIPSLNRISGMAAYHNGIKTFHLQTDGSVQMGQDEGNRISFSPISGSIDIIARSLTMAFPKEENGDILEEKTIEDYIASQLQNTSNIIGGKIDDDLSTVLEKIYKTLQDNYATNGDIGNLSGSITNLDDVLNGKIDGGLSGLQTIIKGLEEALKAFEKTVTTQIKFSEDGLMIYNSGSLMTTRINETEISFLKETKENSGRYDILSYVNNNKISTKEVISDRVTLGSFSWVKTSSGNLSLKWI